MTKQPGKWQVFDLKSDPAEKNDLSGKHPELIAQAVEVLRREVAENDIFPMTVPAP